MLDMPRGTRKKYGRKKTRRVRRRQRGGSDGFKGDKNTLVVKMMGGVPTLMNAEENVVNDPNGLEHSAERVEEV